MFHATLPIITAIAGFFLGAFGHHRHVRRTFIRVCGEDSDPWTIIANLGHDLDLEPRR